MGLFFFFCSLRFSVSYLFYLDHSHLKWLLIAAIIFTIAIVSILTVFYMLPLFFVSFYFHIFYLLCLENIILFNLLSAYVMLLLKILSDCLWVLNMCNRNLLQLYSYLMRIPYNRYLITEYISSSSLHLFIWLSFISLICYQFSSV